MDVKDVSEEVPDTTGFSWVLQSGIGTTYFRASGMEGPWSSSPNGSPDGRNPRGSQL